MLGSPLHDDDLPIALRAPLPSDTELLYACWIRCLSKQAPWRALDRHYFGSAQHALIERLLSVGTTVVACDRSDDEQVFGYAVAGSQPRLLHWLYVKRDFRQGHVATRLLLALFGDFASPLRVTVMTPAMRHHVRRWHLALDSRALAEDARHATDHRMRAPDDRRARVLDAARADGGQGLQLHAG